MASPDVAADPDRLRDARQDLRRARRRSCVRTASTEPPSPRPRRRAPSPRTRPTRRWRRTSARRPNAPRSGPPSSAAELEQLLVPEGPERRQGRDRRDPRRRRRPGGGAVGRRAVRDVPAPRGAPAVEDRGARRRRPRTSAGSRRSSLEVRGQGRVLAAEARVGRPPRAARPRDRVPGPDPHLDRDGRGAARGRGRRGRDPARGPPDRRVPLERARRPVGEHDGLGGADHPQADRDQGRGARRSGRSCRTGRRRCATCAPGCYQLAQDEAQAKEAAARRSQVGTGERAEKIRTYNFPEDRVTDHRIKHTSHQLQDVLAGGEDSTGSSTRCSPPSAPSSSRRRTGR